MVDIIIPYYNAGKTINKTLASIAMQTIKEKIHVIVVDDCSEFWDLASNNFYDKFKPILDIEIIRLDENGGAGRARRIGMQNGKNPYIMFIDADDTFYSAFAVEKLANEMEKHPEMDVINSWFLEELDQENTFARHEHDVTWVFGKIYRRSFIEENKIYFNDSRACEDCGFNAVAFNYGKHGEFQEVTYVWHNNPNSITRVDDKIYTFTCVQHFLINMEWAIRELERLDLDKEKLAVVSAKHFVLTYFYFLQFYYSEDKRYDINVFKTWVQRYYENVFKHIELKEGQLEEVYKDLAKSQGAILLNKIPPLTLYGYIEWISKKA